MVGLKDSWDVHTAVGAETLPASPARAALAAQDRRDAEDRAQARQDRDDFNREMSGADVGKMRRFIFDRNDPRTREGRDRQRKESQSRTALLTAAAWDAQKVMIAGVEMTNAEAQAARQRILDNPERYAGWARERGHIRAGQEGEFIRTVRRMHELKQRERDGILENHEKQEIRDLESSALGRAADHATAQAHKDYGLSREANVRQAESGLLDADDATQSQQLRAALAPAHAGSAREIFPTAPLPQPAFAAAAVPGTAADQPAQHEPVQPGDEPQPVNRTVAATGLNL